MGKCMKCSLENGRQRMDRSVATASCFPQRVAELVAWVVCWSLHPRMPAVVHGRLCAPISTGQCTPRKQKVKSTPSLDLSQCPVGSVVLALFAYEERSHASREVPGMAANDKTREKQIAQRMTPGITDLRSVMTRSVRQALSGISRFIQREQN